MAAPVTNGGHWGFVKCHPRHVGTQRPCGLCALPSWCPSGPAAPTRPVSRAQTRKMRVTRFTA